MSDAPLSQDHLAWLREYGEHFGYDETDFNPFQWAADEIERLRVRKHECEYALRELMSIPAVRMAVGTKHVGPCTCGMCLAQNYFSEGTGDRDSDGR